MSRCKELHDLEHGVLKPSLYFFQLIPDLYPLGAVCLALAALHALRRHRGLVLHRGTHEIFTYAVVIILHIRGLVGPETSRYIDSRGAGHAVTAACTSDPYFPVDLLYDLLIRAHIIRRQGAAAVAVGVAFALLGDACSSVLDADACNQNGVRNIRGTVAVCVTEEQLCCGLCRGCNRLCRGRGSGDSPL